MTNPAAELELITQLDDLQKIIGEGNAARGFHSEGDLLREAALPDPHGCDDGTQICGVCKARKSALRNYYMTKIALIVTEAAEALEELRHGKDVAEQYEVGSKPEGVPSEIADIVIRCFDFADEAGFSLGDVIIDKLKFNATRGKMHGGKVV